MSQSSTAIPAPAPASVRRSTGGESQYRLLVTLVLAALPPPAGLAQHAWLYFAIFAGVIAALVTEPLPNPAVGLIGLSLTALLSPYTLFAPADLAKPGFKVASQTISWALSGFSSTTVWLVAAHSCLPSATRRRGLGRRIALLLVRALGKQHAAGRLCHDAGRCRPGAVHALQHRAQRRHPVPDRQQPAVALQLAAERCVGASVRRLHHVDDVRRRLRHQLTVHDRLRAELPGDRVHRQDRARAHQLPAVDEGLAAVRTAAAAGAAAAGLLAVSARDQAQHRGDHMGWQANCARWARSRLARSFWRCW